MKKDGCSFGALKNTEKAVSFIPFLLGLHPEYCNLVDTGLLSEKLLNNEDDMYPAPPGRDEKSFDVFVRLKEKGFIESSQARGILQGFFMDTVWSDRSFEFIERRFRLLIELDPTILEPEEIDGCNHFMRSIIKYHVVYGREIDHPAKPDIRFYELMLELGKLYFPNELLGLGFHGHNFLVACAVFGEEPVRRLVKDELQNTIARSGDKKNKSLLPSILKAATDEFIHLDGLYELIRVDPGVLTHAGAN